MGGRCIGPLHCNKLVVCVFLPGAVLGHVCCQRGCVLGVLLFLLHTKLSRLFDGSAVPTRPNKEAPRKHLQVESPDPPTAELRSATHLVSGPSTSASQTRSLSVLDHPACLLLREAGRGPMQSESADCLRGGLLEAVSPAPEKPRQPRMLCASN